jgi:hypothetical protein
MSMESTTLRFWTCWSNALCEPAIKGEFNTVVHRSDLSIRSGSTGMAT